MPNTVTLKSSPTLFLEMDIKSFVLDSPDNRLKELDDSPYYEEPMVGFADGDDPLFLEYRTIIADFHLTPREALSRYLASKLNIEAPPGGPISVISIALPIARETRLSNRRMTLGPSLKWNHVRWHGQSFTDELARRVVSQLQEQGYRAVAPDLTDMVEVVDLPNGRCSNWSQRHIAYAAGLGTFGLSDGFITPRGIATWFTSIVTDMKLRPTHRPYASHVANCPFLVEGTCGMCAARCPAGAITAQGHDKIKCRAMLYAGQKQWLEKPGYLGRYAGCGLCLTGVPCESRIPGKVSKRFIP